jgi:hypothetical protein
MQFVGDRTLTSKAGSFTFSPNLRLSHAKLIRDTVTAGFLGAIPHTPRPTPERVIGWVREHMDGPIGKDHTFTVKWTQPEGNRINHIVLLPNGRLGIS